MSAFIRRIKAEEVEQLVKQALADDHVVLYPTHVVIKNDEIVGYLSVGAIPVVNLWMDSERMTARDSTVVLGQLNAIMDHSNVRTYFMPCEKRSPYYPLMQKMGFGNLGSTDLFIKQAGALRVEEV